MDQTPTPDAWTRLLEALAIIGASIGGTLGIQRIRRRSPDITASEMQSRYEERKLAHDAHEQVPILFRRVTQVGEQLDVIIKNQMEIIQLLREKRNHD